MREVSIELPFTAMITIDLLVIAPDEWSPDYGVSQLHTPYGALEARVGSLGSLRVAWVAAGASPFAAIYAAKGAGAARVVELAPVAPHNRLLDHDDLLLPSDLVDRTRLPRYTFFAGKGYGFLAQREPFCLALRGALLAAAVTRAPRVFARGVYLATDDPHTIEPEWDADVAGDGVVPASFLARELELCYATLCIVTDDESAIYDVQWAEALLADTLSRLPEERTCVCATAMRQYRDRGDIGPDWREWVST
jgi:5'-methylthioadenosine phosphorylase